MGHFLCCAVKVLLIGAGRESASAIHDTPIHDTSDPLFNQRVGVCYMRSPLSPLCLFWSFLCLLAEWATIVDFKQSIKGVAGRHFPNFKWKDPVSPFHFNDVSELTSSLELNSTSRKSDRLYQLPP